MPHRQLITVVLGLLLFAATTAGQEKPVQQQPTQNPAPAQSPAKATEQLPVYPKIVITAGRSSVLATDYDVKRLAVTNPAVADATVVEPRQILVDAKSPGTVSLIIWGGGAERSQFDVVVQPGITTLQQRLQELFPGEDIQVAVNDDALMLSGRVSSTEVMLKVGEIAQASASKLKVINLLQLPGGIQSQQVMLQVRFAEVNRKAITELGVNFFTGPTGYKNVVGRTTTQQFPAPTYDNLKTTRVGDQLVAAEGEITFSDFLNLFIFSNKYNVGALVKALKQKGYFQSLAEPNLIAYNGQKASFLAGGEFPVPVVQGGSNVGAVTIDWREFGIRLNFTPTIAGDMIRLHVAPEVSALDFANGITLGGYRVPALTSRRAETEVELRDGQSFAIAGLLDNISQTDTAAIPILSQIPIIGYLFKSKAERQEQTELMVLITPRLVRALAPDEVPPLPTMPGQFLPPPKPKGGVGGVGQDGGVADAPPVKPTSKKNK